GLESEAPHRGRLPQSAASVRETTRVKAAAPSESAHAAALPEVGVDLEVEAARGLRLKNPVLTASGTFGQGVEYAELIDVSRLGAIVNKGTTPAARPGNPQYRIAETPSGILNSIGLENPGAAEVADRKSTRLNSSHLVISYAVFCLKKKNKSQNLLSHANR